MNAIKEHWWILLFSLLVFTVGVVTDINHTIVLLLEFLIIVEITRMVIEFLEGKRIKIRYLFDSAIFFVMKEMYIAVTLIKINLLNNSKLIGIYGILIVFFVILRILVMKVSPTEIENIKG